MSLLNGRVAQRSAMLAYWLMKRDNCKTGFSFPLYGVFLTVSFSQFLFTLRNFDFLLRGLYDITVAGSGHSVPRRV